MLDTCNFRACTFNYLARKLISINTDSGDQYKTLYF